VGDIGEGKEKLLGRAQRVINRGSTVLHRCSGIVIGCLTVLVAYSAISRYAFNRAVFFVEELAGLLLVVSAFLAFAYVFTQGGHIKLTLITSRLPPRVRGLLEIVVSVVAFGYLIILTKLSYDFVWRSYLLDCHSNDAGLYEVPWMSAMPLGLLMFSLVVLMFGLGAGLKLRSTWQHPEQEKGELKELDRYI
jgi:TRAP-type C4-dicarboxylate transport system permease small subunit